MKLTYIAPEAKEILVLTNETILVGSGPDKSFSGEDLTQDSEYDPW